MLTLLAPLVPAQEPTPPWRSLPPATTEEQRLIEEQGRELNAGRYPRVALFILLATVAWWPIDLAAFGCSWERFSEHAIWRLHIIVAMAVFLLVARRVPAYRRYPTVFGAVVVTDFVVFLGWYLSGLGGLEAPHYHYLALACMVSVVAILPLGWRVATTSAVSLAAAIAFFARDPSHLDHPLLITSLAQQAFVTLFAVVLGHMIHRLTLRSLLQQIRLSRQQEQLTLLNDTLAERVEAQTRDLRLLLRQLEAVSQEERSELARELHDELGQELTALRYALRLARQHLKTAPAKAERLLDEVDGLLDRTRTTMRRILTRLRPLALEQLGLAAALRWTVEDLASRAEVAARLTLDPPDLDLDALGLPEPRALTLFRAVQEALTNVARHAQASSVEVTVARTDEGLRLSVVDDGVGLPAEVLEGDSGGGVGMIGMRERMTAAGGAVHWANGDPGGARLTADLPLE